MITRRREKEMETDKGEKDTVLKGDLMIRNKIRDSIKLTKNRFGCSDCRGA